MLFFLSLLILTFSNSEVSLYIGHRTILCAYECADLHSELVSFLHSPAAEDCRTERTGERIAGTYSVCHFHPGSFLM